MKAIILAAGYGNRMRPLTDNNHKTLLQIAGEPIIDRIMSGFISHDIKDVVVVTGYRQNDLRTHLDQTYSHVNITYVHNEKYRETNNIFSLALAFQQVEINDDILLIESDLIYEPHVLDQIVNSRYSNVALLSLYQRGMDGTVVKVADDKITEVIPPHLQDENFDFSDKYKTLNIYKFSRAFCNNEFQRLLEYYATVVDDNCYYELILGILIYMQREQIFCEVVDHTAWAEVDDPNDLRGAEFQFNTKDRRNLLEGGFGGYWNYDITDFCFIRNMYFPTPSIISEIKNSLTVLMRNYGSKQTILNEKLSYVLQVQKERLLLLNGAAQIFPILGRIFIDKKVAIPDPTFGEYPRVFGDAIRYFDRVGFDLEYLEKLIKQVDLFVAVNPNNPSGSLIESEWIFNCAKEYPDTIFLVDESFIEFSGQITMLDLLESESLDNVLVIRSMSKSYGLPGIRLGFAYTANHDLLAEISREIPVWNSNSIAEFYLEVLLKNRTDLLSSFARTATDRDAFASDLSNLEVVEKVYPSSGNYLLVKLNLPHDKGITLIRYLLEEHKLYVKDVTNKIGEDDKTYFRLAVRLPEENNSLIRRINNIGFP